MKKILFSLFLLAVPFLFIFTPEVSAVCNYCPKESVDTGTECVIDSGKPTQKSQPKLRGCLSPQVPTHPANFNAPACQCVDAGLDRKCPAGSSFKCPGGLAPEIDNLCTISSGKRQAPTCLPDNPAVPGAVAPVPQIIAQPCTAANCTRATGSPCEPDAADVTSAGPGIMTAIGCVPSEPKALVEGLLKYGSLAAGAIAFLIMILAALQMITAEGNPESIKHAQERFYSAIIGLLLIVFSVLLMQVIGVDLLDLPGFER